MVKEQILQWAIINFAKLGIKGVSMSYIAKELSISKKTIYDYFSSKQELLTECIKQRIDQNSQLMTQAQQSANSTLETILLINKMTLKQSLSLCPAFYYEVKNLTYATELLESHVQFIYEQYRKSFKKGIEEGIFPKDYNCESALTFFDEQIKAICFNPPKNEMKPIETYTITIFTYLAGVCTNKGREELNKFNKNQFYK